jgi:hypothetical protein
MAKGSRAVKIDVHTVRPAVANCLDHVPENLSLNRLTAAVDYAANAAHEPAVPLRVLVYRYSRPYFSIVG